MPTKTSNSPALGAHIPYNQICALADYGDGRLLISTNFNGLYLYDKSNYRRFRAKADELLHGID
ncbi:MAG: hypothetical protein SNH16_04160 [Rikenellaceae bacterium]